MFTTIDHEELAKLRGGLAESRRLHKMIVEQKLKAHDEISELETKIKKLDAENLELREANQGMFKAGVERETELLRLRDELASTCSICGIDAEKRDLRLLVDSYKSALAYAEIEKHQLQTKLASQQQFAAKLADDLGTSRSLNQGLLDDIHRLDSERIIQASQICRLRYDLNAREQR